MRHMERGRVKNPIKKCYNISEQLLILKIAYEAKLREAQA